MTKRGRFGRSGGLLGLSVVDYLAFIVPKHYFCTVAQDWNCDFSSKSCNTKEKKLICYV